MNNKIIIEQFKILHTYTHFSDNIKKILRGLVAVIFYLCITHAKHKNLGYIYNNKNII